jgi:hypothetical protein
VRHKVVHLPDVSRDHLYHLVMSVFSKCARAFSCDALVIPAHVRVDDRRVVWMYNILRGVLIVITIVVFIFVQRGFVAPVDILVNPNAWMNGSPVGSDTPAYCDNEDIHYYWSDDWVYRNITCKPLSLNERFIKFLGVGNFFVPTMTTEKKFMPCPEERETTYALAQHGNVSNTVCRGGYLRQVGDQRHSFVMWADDSMVSAEISVTIPAIDFDSREQAMRHELSLPNGTVLQYEDIEGFAGQILTLPLRTWVSMLGIEDGLDTINKKIDTKDAVGGARLRMAGLVINIGITVSNIPAYGLPGEVYCRWELDSEFVWSRITLPDQNLPTGAVESTDVYGVRFRMSARKSEVMLPNLKAGFSGLVELVVFMLTLRIVAHMIALNCFGKDSKRWKQAAFNHVDQLTDLPKLRVIKESLNDLRRNSVVNLNVNKAESCDLSAIKKGRRKSVPNVAETATAPVQVANQQCQQAALAKTKVIPTDGII